MRSKLLRTVLVRGRLRHRTRVGLSSAREGRGLAQINSLPSLSLQGPAIQSLHGPCL